MAKIAFLFAGQGAQAPGMGKSLYECSKKAAAVFDTMERLRPGTLQDCFEASPERLCQTPVTQPCVYTVALAAAAALEEAGVKAEGAAGFSLGEMAALTFAGVFDEDTGGRLVCKRGEVMDKAAGENPGKMVAVLRLPDEKVEELCKGFKNLWPVNYNCPGQLVVAGSADEITGFCAGVKNAGGMARPLAVSGAFHTPFMQGAAQAFLQQLAQVKMDVPQVPVYANLTAQPYSGIFADTLAAQMHSPVRWSASVLQMGADGFDTFIEVGPGKTLSGLVKRILPEAKILNVQDEESLAETLSALAQ